MRMPTYLRIVATTRCNYTCLYCHHEGEARRKARAAELGTRGLMDCLELAARSGIRKYKFLGGEPLLREDLPELIRAIRVARPCADISVITAGAVALERLDRCWDAGLSRVNISIHGFGREAFALRNRAAGAFELRERFIESVVRARRSPLKVNYVYSGRHDLEDLAALLAWGSRYGLLINVLDNLSLDLGWRDIAAVVRMLRGEPDQVAECPDPDSFPTIHWIYSDGLRVEIKHRNLGQFAPYVICRTCPGTARCKEGIFAIRLTHDGYLKPCMDREDVKAPIAEILACHGPEAAFRAWEGFLRFWVHGEGDEQFETHPRHGRMPRFRKNDLGDPPGETLAC